MHAAPVAPQHTPTPAPDVQVRTRGLNPLAALAYVREHGGEGAIKQVLAKLPERDLQLLAGSKKLSSKAWVPFSLQGRLLQAIDETLGTGDHARLFDVGAFMSTRDIPRVFRPLLKLGNPGWILEVSTRIWRFYHSTGHWEIQRTPVTVLATLHDHEAAHEAFCATFVGWLTNAVEMSGGYDVMVDHPVCHARGAPNCVFTVRWSLDDEGPPAPSTEIHDPVSTVSSEAQTSISKRHPVRPGGRSRSQEDQ
jgi:hypothetical protein